MYDMIQESSLIHRQGFFVFFRAASVKSWGGGLGMRLATDSVSKQGSEVWAWHSMLATAIQCPVFISNDTEARCDCMSTV